MSFIDPHRNYYTGERAPGGISVNAKPSINHRLKPNWQSSIPDVWEYDTIGAQSALVSRINTEADAKFNEILSKYPKGEVDTWGVKAPLAQIWLGYSDADKLLNIANIDFVMLFKEAVNKSVILESDIPAVTSLATKIIRDKTVYSAFAGGIMHVKTQLKDQVSAAMTEEDHKNIVVDYSSISFTNIVQELTPPAPPPVIPPPN